MGLKKGNPVKPELASRAVSVEPRSVRIPIIEPLKKGFVSTKEVIENFCALSTKVRVEKFNNEVPADCFCHHSVDTDLFQFSEEVMTFIIEAIDQKLEEEPC